MACNPPQGRRFDSPFRSRRSNLAMRRGTDWARIELVLWPRLPMIYERCLPRAGAYIQNYRFGKRSEIEGMGRCSGLDVSTTELPAIAVREWKGCALMARDGLAGRVISSIPVASLSCWCLYRDLSRYALVVFDNCDMMGGNSRFWTIEACLSEVYYELPEARSRYRFDNK